MTPLLILKLLIVALFLIMFLRKTGLIWGIGLLSVTSAVLLDTFLGVFNREQMLAELGFFFYVITGALFAGTAIWLWGILQPITATATAAPLPAAPRQSSEQLPSNHQERGSTAFDRQMLYEQIYTRFGREDIHDLIFDLDINENDVMTLDQNLNQLIINIMDWAEQHGQAGPLALAVERILTPLPPENLPRLEKITADSPPTVLRQYMLAHYTLPQLAQMAASLGLDWEQLGSGSKKEKIRALLLYLMRRNRLAELIQLMHAPIAISS
jgi:hypothetical protein